VAKRKSKHLILLDSIRPFYARILELQNGHCALCPKEPSPKRRLDLDHDHRNMYVRGLLCHRCNRGLPSWMTPEWLRAAADYLEKGDPGYGSWGLHPTDQNDSTVRDETSP
jgi:hypothetical protein